MKKLLLLLCLLSVTGCLNIDSNEESSVTNTNTSTNIGQNKGCPEKPTKALKSENITNIQLTGQLVNYSGQVNVDQMVAYTFDANSGQKLSFENSDNTICTWVFAPDTQLVKGTELSQTGTYTFQVGTIKGSKTFDVSMGLDVSKSSPSNEPISTETPSESPPPVETTSSTVSNSLTESEAKSIVQGWYDAKPLIFGREYNRSLVEKYATGQLYYDTLQKEDNSDGIISYGSQGWLNARRCYYTYGFSNIDNVWLFDNKQSKPYLKIQVHENFRLNGPSKCNWSSSRTYRKNVEYWFAKDNGVWKIEHYKVE
jgi:hypothetical protein